MIVQYLLLGVLRLRKSRRSRLDPVTDLRVYVLRVYRFGVRRLFSRRGRMCEKNRDAGASIRNCRNGKPEESTESARGSQASGPRKLSGIDGRQTLVVCFLFCISVSLMSTELTRRRLIACARSTTKQNEGNVGRRLRERWSTQQLGDERRTTNLIGSRAGVVGS